MQFEEILNMRLTYLADERKQLEEALSTAPEGDIDINLNGTTVKCFFVTHTDDRRIRSYIPRAADPLAKDLALKKYHKYKLLDNKEQTADLLGLQKKYSTYKHRADKLADSLAFKRLLNRPSAVPTNNLRKSKKKLNPNGSALAPSSASKQNIAHGQMANSAGLRSRGVAAYSSSTPNNGTIKHPSDVNEVREPDILKARILADGMVGQERSDEVKQVITLDQKIEIWENEPFFSNPEFPDYLTVPSAKNIMVRSKSEDLIAHELFRHKIPFHYEEALIVDRTKVYPDFLIVHPINGRFYIWEHFGMMDEPDYARRAIKKLDLYARDGFVVGVNLIISTETQGRKLSTSMVDALILDFFGVS